MRTIGDGSSGGAVVRPPRRAGAGESHLFFASLILARSLTDFANEPFGPVPPGSRAKKSITPTPVLVLPAVNMPSVSSDAAASDVAASAAARISAAVPDPVAERLAAAVDAAAAALPGDLAASAGSLPALPALLLAAVAAALARAAAGGGGAGAGMDEWAALAAAEGDAEPAELREYDPAAIQRYFRRRPLTFLRRTARSGRR